MARLGATRMGDVAQGCVDSSVAMGNNRSASRIEC